MKVNLNQKVKVKVTQKGKAYLYLRQVSLGLHARDIEEDLEGWSIWQLWELFGIFGDAFQYPTIDPVIDPEIKIL